MQPCLRVGRAEEGEPDGSLKHVLPSGGKTSQLVVCGSLSSNDDVSCLECLAG